MPAKTTTTATSGDSGSIKSSSPAWQQATALPVGHACARLVIGVVHFLVQLQDNPHDGTSTSTNTRIMPLLNGDALWHLRESLQDSMYTTVEYLKYHQQEQQEYHSSSNTNDDDTSLSNSFLSISIRLLGTLLREVDIWQLQDDASQKGILECLEGLLLSESKDHDYSLLPGLVAVLVGAEGDTVKLAQLTSLWDPLCDYLEGYWQRDPKQLAEKLRDNNGMSMSIAWACSCTELWVALDGRKELRRRLALCMIEWIQSVLQAHDEWNVNGLVSLEQLQSYLSLAVGCYMALETGRDQPPREHESRVIFRALQVCEMQPTF
jgi:hypothetical protein